MNNFFKLTLAGAIALAMSGCNSIPSFDDYEKNKPDNKYAMDKAVNNDEWLQDPAIQKVFSNVGQTITKPNKVPYSIRNKNIDLKLTPNSSMQDLLTAISKGMNISTISDSEELSEMPVYIPYFNGKLGDLLDSISKSKNLSFTWDSNVLTLKQNATYMVALPQDEELMTKVSSELAGLGAVEINNSVSAGVIFYNSNPKNQQKIEKYYNRLIKNSSLITLQIMVINVNMERQRKEGFDWSQMQAMLGDLELSDSVTSNDSDSSSGDSDSDSDSSSNIGYGDVASITGNGLTFNVSKNGFNLVGLFNLLSSYGNTKTTQDVSLKTISGKQVEMESNQEIPYVSDVDLSTTDNGVSNSGLDTDTAKNGLTINLMPYYEAESNLVSINIELSLESLLGFVELSAGNQFGTITQPRTQIQRFNNTIRIPAGDTVILGGVTYESLSDNRASLSVLDKANLADQDLDLTNNSLFVLIRPTVVMYENNQENQNE